MAKTVASISPSTASGGPRARQIAWRWQPHGWTVRQQTRPEISAGLISWMSSNHSSVSSPGTAAALDGGGQSEGALCRHMVSPQQHSLWK